MSIAMPVNRSARCRSSRESLPRVASQRTPRRGWTILNSSSHTSPCAMNPWSRPPIRSWSRGSMVPSSERAASAVAPDGPSPTRSAYSGEV